MNLWDRSIAVSFGPKGKENEGVKITGLRISFEITKTSESTPNTAKINIYNLSPEHRALLETSEDLGIILETGYGGNLEELFAGDIKLAKTESSADKLEGMAVTTLNQGPDKATTIEAVSGHFAIEQATVDKSYAEKTSTVTVLSDVINSFSGKGVYVGNALNFVKSGAIVDKIAQMGMVLSGPSSTHMDNLSSNLGLEWSIQDNDMQIISQDGKTTEDAVLLNQDTGLIGSPIWKKDGIEFTALINPKIKPGRAVAISIESKQYTGFFRVWRAVFSGDSHDQSWFVKAEAKE